MSAPMMSNHTARKQWRCDAGYTCCRADHPDHTRETPRNLIEPGERYTAEVFPPWTRMQEDPDSPVIALGEWVTHRYHVECYVGPW